ncbi:MAG: porin [Deltaproteobacteria bacterium]|nr:porin [Deltaproteobacteria bacterium]
MRLRSFAVASSLAFLLFSARAAHADPGSEGEPGADAAPGPAAPEPAPAAPAPAPPAPAPPAPAPLEPVQAPEAKPEAATDTLKVTPTGYVEAFYAYNFNEPSNGVTNYRGFDNRHNTFSLSNAALGATAEYGPVSAKVMLQIGSTPASYYSAEPGLAGAGGANASTPELWRYLQEAYLGYKAPVGRGLLVQAGLFASPIGMEMLAVKDHWTWSRSNLFFGLPYYHAGARATYELTDELSVTLAVFNGWNSVVDNNDGKSVQTNLTYKAGETALLNVLYFGGPERAAGAPEGPAWRHDWDVVGQLQMTPWLSGALQINAGFEETRWGTAGWYAGAIAARVRAAKWLYFVARGDRFHEALAREKTGARRVSAPIFWAGAEWVSEGTFTVDLRPHDNVSFRIELRHDEAEAPLYFRGNVQGDGSSAAPFVPNARAQNTLLVGATAWF